MPPHDQDALDADLAHVVRRIATELGPPPTWPSPVLVEGLALCIMNALYSTGNRSEAVVQVLDRYRRRRLAAGADPAADGPAELSAEIESCGGHQGFADALGNHWRAWQSKTAPYKTKVVYEAAALLANASVHDRDGLEAALKDPAVHDRLKKGWLSLPGQRSGLTWRFFLMNSGIPGVKADRMITRWTSRALGRAVTPLEAERILIGAAERLGVEARRLDHAVWGKERKRG